MTNGRLQDDHHHARRHHGKGPTSFAMHDSDAVFRALRLVPGETFLDMGCGPGDYAMAGARCVGPTGTVVALDASPRMTSALSARAEAEGAANVKTITADITGPLPLDDASVDLCLLSTVLHIVNIARVGEQVFTETVRLLRPGGRVAVIECKKVEADFGPPLSRRLSPEDVSVVAEGAGLVRSGYVDLGHTYLVLFAHDATGLESALDRKDS